MTLHKERIFQEAADLYFDVLAETGKPLRTSQLYARLSEKLELENEIVASLLRDPEFDKMLLSRRRRHIIEEAALKVTAAEYAEHIQNASLARLVDLLSDPDAKIPAKDLIAAAKLASELNAEVDKDLEAVTKTSSPTINIEVKELLMSAPAGERVGMLEEVLRRLNAPGREVVDGDCDEE